MLNTEDTEVLRGYISPPLCPIRSLVAGLRVEDEKDSLTLLKLLDIQRFNTWTDGFYEEGPNEGERPSADKSAIILILNGPHGQTVHIPSGGR